jgi:CheY-like chemotaxis protein
VPIKQKILAVEDDEFSLELLRHFLSEAEYDVMTAIDGLDALRKLEENPSFDLILLDRVLPKLGGIDLILKIRADERFQDIPIVMQSALALPEQVLEGKEAGAVYYLTKPFDRSALLQAVKSALEAGRVDRSAENELDCDDPYRRGSAGRPPA